MSSRHNSQSGAPLPSPAAATASQRFSFPTAAQQEATRHQAPTLQQDHATCAKNGAMGGGDISQYHNSMDTSSPFRNDLNLVAEAAKRAQMSVLMRDMGDVAL
jgi:hypothetical protein